MKQHCLFNFLRIPDPTSFASELTEQSDNRAVSLRIKPAACEFLTEIPLFFWNLHRHYELRGKS